MKDLKEVDQDEEIYEDNLIEDDESLDAVAEDDPSKGVTKLTDKLSMRCWLSEDMLRTKGMLDEESFSYCSCDIDQARSLQHLIVELFENGERVWLGVFFAETPASKGFFNLNDVKLWPGHDNLLVIGFYQHLWVFDVLDNKVVLMTDHSKFYHGFSFTSDNENLIVSGCEDLFCYNVKGDQVWTRFYEGASGVLIYHIDDELKLSINYGDPEEDYEEVLDVKTGKFIRKS